MFKTDKNIIALLVILLMTAFAGKGQTLDSVYVGGADSIFLSNKDTMSVFGNIEHNGTWGTTTGSYVYFLGQTWKNTPTAQFPLMNASATDGGIFCITPAAAYSQIINGGYNRRVLSQGPVFPNIEIANLYNVYLDSTDAAVLNKVKMDSGLVYLSANAGGLDNTENSLVLGGGTLKPQVINYSLNKYFVSGALPDDTSYLYIRNIASSDTAVFPIGSKAKDFTPASVMSTSGDFMARVFDGVYQKGGSGTLITDASFLPKTWQVVTPLVAAVTYSPILQHHLTNETPLFAKNRAYSYISMFDAGTNSWDVITPNNPTYGTPLSFPSVGSDADTVFYQWRTLSNIMNSDLGTYLTKRINLSTSLGIIKSVIGVEPVLADGTFNIGYEFVITNNNLNPIDDIDVKDDLSTVFKSPATFSIKTLNSTTGVLSVNTSYDGKTDIDMVKNGALQSRQSDTLIMVVNLNLNNTDDILFNNVSIVGIEDTSGANKGLFQPIDTSSAATTVAPITAFIPDGFSPNGDGINDKFVILHKSYESIDMVVYNRWGNVVYKADNYQNDWDGKGMGNFLGKDLEEGTYYILVTIKNKTANTRQKVVKFITLRRSF